MKELHWKHKDQLYSLGLTTTSIIVIVTVFALITELDAAFSHSYRRWNDDDGITGWNPNWFSSLKYSQPIGIRNRGYLYKRLNRQKWNAFIAPPLLVNPFDTKRKFEDLGNAVTKLRLPSYTAGKKALGWYSGPGSSYQVRRNSDSDVQDDQDQDSDDSVEWSETSREQIASPIY